MLEPPRRGGSNEYPQCMFLIKNKKNRYTPAVSYSLIYKSEFKVVFIARTCFPDDLYVGPGRKPKLLVFLGEVSFF